MTASLADEKIHDGGAHEKEDLQTISLDNDGQSKSPERVTFTEEEARKVIRKIDYNLLPLCFILYTFSVLDRSNLGNAKLAGLSKDIDIGGNHYAWLGNAFYIAYVLFQFTTIGWKLFKPHKWVACVVLFWGVVSTIQAACTSWAGLMTASSPFPFQHGSVEPVHSICLGLAYLLQRLLWSTKYSGFPGVC